MKKRILSIVLSIVMLVSLLPTTVLAVEASATEASWVFGASGITPDYTDAATGTLTEAFTAANANEDNTTIYVQLNKNVIAENNQYFSLGSNKSMVLDLNEKTISSSDSIYCIYTLSGSSLAVKNGTITVNETKNTGYGFFVNGALTVENCTINAEQTSSNSVYGINGRKGSSLTVKNSSITARNTENSGSAYGIYADQGTLTVENCNISAESSNRDAYGISTYYTNASISEGTISAQTNSSSYRAYGVYSSYGSVTLSGTPGISATTADFYYPSTSNYKVVFTGTMSAPSEPYSFIGRSGYGFTAGANLCNINANNFSSYFKAADPAEEVIYDNGELKLVNKPYVWFCTGDGTDVDNIYLPYSGGMATQPADPTWEGYTFAGWYTDGTYTTKFNFTQTITQNTGVYAKWTFAATGAEVEDSGTLNGTYGSTLDELIEATLSKLSITVTGENGASLGGFSTSNWTVKEEQELAAAQLGDTVTFVGTLTAPTATNYDDTYDFWYGRLAQWEGELSIEVSLVLDYNVKFSNYNYTTNGDGIMAYTIKTNAFDIIGYFDRNWRSTTYGNGGYKTYLKVGDTVEQMSTATSAGDGDTKLGLNVAIDFDFLNNGQTLQIKYTVNNTTEYAIAFSLGSGADVKIGSDDSALITPFADGSGYKMVSDNYNDQSAQGDYAQFNFFGKGYAGVTDVTDFWYGGWSNSKATNGCYWSNNESVAAFYGVAHSESLNADSAASWHWDDSIGAGETKTYSILIGIGGAGSENAAQGGGLTEATGSVTIEVSEDLTSSNQLVVKLGETTLTENTHYTVDLTDPDKPVITFTEAAGLNVSSRDLTVTVTFADQGTEKVIITNSIPGTGNISTEEGVLGGVTAEGLDELAKEQNQDIVLTVKEEEKNTEDVEHNAIDTAAGDKTVEFLDITLKDKNSGALITGILSKVLEIAVPFDADGKSDITVYRYHGSAVNTFTSLDARPANADAREDGTFFVDGENNKVYIYTNQFSTYAIGYTMLSTTCTVTFDMNGHGTAIDPATVNSGEKVTKPADPTATGYTFGGWYKEQACTTAWDFDTDTVSGATTLYAKWTEKATVNITETAQTYTWDGNPQSFIISGIPNTGFAVQYKVNGNWTDTAPSAVGTYNVKITRAEDDTYKAYENEINGGLVIQAAPPTANAPTAIIGLIYNGSAQALINAGTSEHGYWEYSLDGTTYLTSIPTGTDAKAYTVYCRFVPNTGYANIDPVERSVTISPKEVAEPTVVGTYTYTGSEQTVTLDGVLGCMTVSGGNKGTNADDFEVSITLDTNHTWKSGSDGIIDWSIEPATPTVTWPTATAYVNDASVTQTGGSATGVGGENVVGSFTLDTIDLTSAGTKTAKITFAPNSTNYKNVEKTDYSVTVSKRTVESVAEQTAVENAVYGTEQAALGLPATVEITVSGNKKFTVPVTWSGYVATNLNAQTLTGTLDLSAIAGEVENTNSVTASIVVDLQEKNAATFNYENKTATYNGSSISHEISGTLEGVASISYSYVGSEYAASSTAPTNAGVYEVTATFTMQPGYAAVAPKTSTLTISPKEVGLDWSELTSVELVYSGTAKTLTATATGLADGDSCTVTVEFVGDIVNVGTFSYKATALSNANYKLPVDVSSPEYTITPKTLTITAEDKETYVGSRQPDLTYTVDGLVGDDALTTAPVLTTDANMYRVGAYTITASGADVGDNYSITYVNGTLTVKNYPYIPQPTYDVEIADDITGGDVSASKKVAYRGDTITITVAPNAGYELTKLTVTDSRNNVVAVTKISDSKYTFKMPGYDVEIDAVFAKIDTTCPRDWTCPMYGYTDLDRTLWYHDGIHYCIEHGLMVGTGTNIFEPNIATSRAMIVTILWRLEGCPIVNYAMDFEDVAADQWYTEAIRWAASEKIVEGYGDGKFGTNDAITREQMVTIMFRYAKYKGYDVSVGENTNILSYDDAFDVAEWAIPAMQWACGSGMIQGIADGNQMNLAPQGNATRAQAAAILQRFCENVANKD